LIFHVILHFESDGPNWNQWMLGWNKDLGVEVKVVSTTTQG